MNFITIEHKDGAITVRVDRIDYVTYSKESDRYIVVLKDLSDRELTKEQYDTFIIRLTC